MSTPNSDRERALRVAREWLDSRDLENDPMREMVPSLADLIQRECAAAREQGARAVEAHEQPEPRDGDVWKCDVEFIVERVPSSFAVAKFDGRTVLVSQRWLRANGRLVSRKEGGA